MLEVWLCSSIGKGVLKSVTTK